MIERVEERLQNASAKKVLFLGKLKHFTQDEYSVFLSKYAIEIASVLDDSVALVVESSMMTPVDDDISYEAYKRKIPFVKLDEFDRLYVRKLNPNSLLAALKLSNDQSRLIRLIKSEAFDDDIFLKLFGMYDWRGEGVFESDENRDVTIAFIKRFYKNDGFMDPSIIYSPITLAATIRDCENAEVLDAAIKIPDFRMNVSKSVDRAPKTLKELVAYNRFTSPHTLSKLSNYNDADIDYFLAQNPNTPKSVVLKLYERGDRNTKRSLAQNSAVSDEIFEKLLDESDEVVETLLANVVLNEGRFETILSKGRLMSSIGLNESVSSIVDRLMGIDDKRLFKNLAQNPTVSTDTLHTLYEKYGDEIAQELSANPNCDVALLREFYEVGGYEEELARNISTPQEILIALFEKNEHAINLNLALNSSMPIEYLQQLQLDNTLLNNLSKNSTFTNAILGNLGMV